MRYAHHKRVVSAVSLFCLGLFLFGFADMDAVDWYARGMDNLGQDLYGDAAEAFSNAITLDPVYQPAYFERGTVYLRLGQYDLAITDLTEAVVCARLGCCTSGDGPGPSGPGGSRGRVPSWGSCGRPFIGDG